MNLYDITDRPVTEQPSSFAKSDGSWVGDLPNNYTVKIRGREYVYSDGRGFIHSLPDGGSVLLRYGQEIWLDAEGNRHRDDGPAIIFADGLTKWYYHGKLHREDGPAVTRADGTVEYWIDGKRVEREDLP